MGQKNKHHFSHSQLNSHVGKTTPKNGKLHGDPNKIIKHHVPPRHPDKVPKTISVNEQSEKAYHLLFGCPPTFEAAVEILKKWWPHYHNSEEDFAGFNS